MKKLATILLCILLVAAMAVTAFAATSAQMTVRAGKTTVSRGETIDFTVDLSTVENCRSGAFRVNYDSNVFEFVSGSCSLSGTTLADFSSGTGTFAYGAGTTVSGQIFTFKLKVKDNAPFGTASVSGNVNTRDTAGEIPTTVNTLRLSVQCSHSYGNWTKVDETNHQRTCTVAGCGDVQTVAHAWNGGTVTKQPSCNKTGERTLTCTDCSATKIVTEPETPHTYGTWTKVNDTTHKHTCTGCTKEETASHTWNSTVTKQPTCKEAGVTTYTCTGCGATKTETIAKLTTHTYDHACDTDCNVCGVTRTTTHSYKTSWSKDKNGHWHACSVCGDKKDSAAHTPGAAATETTAQTCTVCGYIIKPALGHKHSYATTWTTDEKGHWYDCPGCEEQGSYAEHDFENACDTLCETCGYERTTTHTYSEEWESDGDNHWHACTACGAKADEAAHIPGMEATETTAQVCTVCEYEIDPALGNAADTLSDGTVQPGQEKAADDTPPGAFPWWIILIIGCGAAAGVIGWLAVKKKK